MKKLILSVTALAACSVGAFAQGTILFDTTSGAGTISINGALNTGTTAQDINAELLYSATGTAGSFAPLVTLLLSSSNTSPDGQPGDIAAAAGDGTFFKGYLQDQSGTVYTLPIAAGAGAFFEVEGWLGANTSSLAAAQAAGLANGTTAVFSETLTASTAPIIASLNNMPALNLVSVPEPSTLAMAGVGLASMLLLRRKAK